MITLSLEKLQNISQEEIVAEIYFKTNTILATIQLN